MKGALEDICQQYRRGQRFSILMERQLSITVKGILTSQPKNEKIIMWCLNTLIHVGRFDNSEKAIINAVSDYGENKQILASAASCIHKLASNPHEVIRKKTHIDERTEYLAACRVKTWEKLAFPPPQIPIDNAQSDELKSALVLVGTNSAPEALFHPHHTNLKIIEELSKHDDKIVQQYCYWALHENSNFNFAALPQHLQDIGQLPDNVRVWAYNLVGSNDNELIKRIDLIKECSLDNYSRARLGLAKGLKDSYFDGLEPIIVDWFQTEANAEIRLQLLEHMASFSDNATIYGNLVAEFFDNGRLTSTEKEHILEAARQTQLYSTLRRVLLDTEPMLDMFGTNGGQIFMTNNLTQNITVGNDNSGNIVVTGGDTHSSLVLNLSEIETKKLHSQMDEIEVILDDPEVLEVEPERISQVKGLIEEVKKTPDKGKVTELTEKLLEINDTIDKLGPLKEKAAALKPIALFLKALIFNHFGGT